MRDVFAADARDPALLIEVEIAVRQTETPLPKVNCHPGAVPRVLIDPNGEERVDTQRLQRKGDVECLGAARDSVYAVEFLLERPDSETLSAGLVHRRAPEVADLPPIPARRAGI